MTRKEGCGERSGPKRSKRDIFYFCTANFGQSASIQGGMDGQHEVVVEEGGRGVSGLL
jgi:hypothetical protein